MYDRTSRPEQPGRLAPRAVGRCVLFLACGLLGFSGCQANDPEKPQGEDAAALQVPADPIAKPAGPGEWRSLETDGLHDPANEAIAYLQDPAEALSVLPKGGPEGNKVDWMAALREGHIAPRTNISPDTNIRTLDLDIVFTETAGMPHVVFPHRQHTEWLDCSNCHEHIFRSRRGANDIAMLDILNGEFCGRCHGAVAFPLTECKRCHNKDWQQDVAN